MHGIRLVWVPFLIPNWAAGQTWGRFILLNRKYKEVIDAKLVAHELVHVVQWKQHGVFGFGLKYLWQLFRYGYDKHPLEEEANANWPLYLDLAERLLREQG